MKAPAIVAAFDAWNTARGAREMQSRRDLDPLTMPRPLLPHILLVDVEHVPRLRFRWRLIGTHITQRLGRDSTRLYWDELYDPAVYKAMCSTVNWVLKERKPVRFLGFAPLDEKTHLSSENIDMPLSTNGSEIDMIMVASVYS